MGGRSAWSGVMIQRSYAPERRLPDLYRFCYYLAILATGFAIGHLLWGRISLPFSNGPGITVGPLVSARYAPLNNTVKFLVFACMPAFLYLCLCVLFRQGMPVPASPTFHMGALRSFFGRVASVLEKHRRWLGWLNVVLLVLFALSGILRFFSLPFEMRPFDIFHEGESLTPAFVYMRSGNLWKGTFFLHGALYDPLITVFSWKFFGAETIGAARLGFLFSYALLPLGLALFIFTTCLALVRNLRGLRAVFLVQVLIFAFIYTNAAGEGAVKIQMLERRDLPVLLSLCALNMALLYRSRVWLLVFGLGSAGSYVYTLDRGAYFSALLLVLLALLMLFPLRKERRDAFRDAAALLLGVLLGWLGFVALFGLEETGFFLLDAREVYATSSLFAGIVYPGSFFYRLPIMAIGLQILFLMVRSLEKYAGNAGSRTKLYIHVTFVCLAVLYFRTALGRSDVAHLYYSSSFAYLGLAFLVWVFASRLHKRYVYALVLLLLILNVRMMATIYRRVKPSKMAAYVANVRRYVELDDSAFTAPELRPAVRGLKQLFAKESHVFNYSSDALLPYLLKKPPVGRNFIVWFSSSNARRPELQRDLVRENPRYIIFSGLYACYDGFCNDQRFPELHPHILKHYAPFQMYGPWAVYERVH